MEWARHELPGGYGYWIDLLGRQAFVTDDGAPDRHRRLVPDLLRVRAR